VLATVVAQLVTHQQRNPCAIPSTWRSPTTPRHEGNPLDQPSAPILPDLPSWRGVVALGRSTGWHTLAAPNSTATLLPSGYPRDLPPGEGKYFRVKRFILDLGGHACPLGRHTGSDAQMHEKQVQLLAK